LPLRRLGSIYGSRRKRCGRGIRGGKLFNARQYASNFDEEKIKEVIHYAHVRDVNVYQTMNILISDSEMREALKHWSGRTLQVLTG